MIGQHQRIEDMPTEHRLKFFAAYDKIASSAQFYFVGHHIANGNAYMAMAIALMHPDVFADQDAMMQISYAQGQAARKV